MMDFSLEYQSASSTSAAASAAASLARNRKAPSILRSSQSSIEALFKEIMPRFWPWQNSLGVSSKNVVSIYYNDENQRFRSV